MENWMKRCSHLSDTSSAYSGSDVMQSCVDDLDIIFSGLPESDGEECFTESLLVRDQVKEYLEKEPTSRTDQDIEVLLDFVQHLPAFSNMTLTVRSSLCSVMTFAAVPKADTVIYGDGQEMDSWSVIVNGHVEISRPDGTVVHLHMGDSFGVTQVADKLLHFGTMRTKVDDCQFVHIKQQDYHKILNQGNQSICHVEEHGKVVLVVEKRSQEDGKDGQVILRGTPEKLILQLIENNATDHSYIEDFLLTYRTFIKSPLDIAKKLYLWLQDPATREKVARIVMLWVNSHFRDFETNPEMMEFLEKFEVVLEEQKMHGQLRLLSMAYDARAHLRSVVLSRSTREEILCFSIIGGLEKRSGIFVTKVEKGSKAFEAGLMRGDQILEVNKHSFELINLDQALGVLRGNTQLAISVKSNIRAFRKVLQLTEYPDQPQRPASGIISDGLSQDTMDLTSAIRTADSCDDFMKLNLKEEQDIISCNKGSSVSQSGSRKNSAISIDFPTRSLSSSSPDLSNTHGTNCSAYTVSDQVVKIYRSDQTFRYILIVKETTAHEVVMRALSKFGITDPSSNFSLNEVTFEDCGLVKSRKLPDQMTNLCEQIRVNSRYYIRDMKSSELLVPDDQTESIRQEVQTNFLDLDPGELALELMRSDFQQFKDIEETEYVKDLFDIESTTGCPNLLQFIRLVNREMFWVVTEICSGPSANKRAKVIKQFIRIARCCKIVKNFNSMFAILSGLGHGAVSRLRQTWDQVPAKDMKLFEEMQCLMDPSRNMSKYRNLLSAHVAHPPVIPFFPIVKKDLTFINDGNDSKVEGLINFDKLRMIAKEVHLLNHLASGVLPNSVTFCRHSGGDYASLTTLAVTSTLTFATMKRKKSIASGPNLRKMHEDMLMARKARKYLANLKIEEDENRLTELSNLSEPPERVAVRKAGSIEGIALVAPSAESLAINPMFGTDSQPAVQKLLTLTDRVKPLDEKRSPLHKVNSLPSRPVRSPKKSPSSTRPRPLLAVDLSQESSSVTGVNLKHRFSMSKGRLPAILPLSASVVKMLDSDSGYGSVTSSSSDTQSVDCISDTSSVTAVQPVADKCDLRTRALQPWSTGAPLVDGRLGHALLRRPNVLLENQCMTRSVYDLKYKSVACRSAAANRVSLNRPLRPPAYEDAIRYSGLLGGLLQSGYPTPPNCHPRLPFQSPGFSGSSSTAALLIQEPNELTTPLSSVKLNRERSYSFDGILNISESAVCDESYGRLAYDLSDEACHSDDEIVSAV